MRYEGIRKWIDKSEGLFDVREPQIACYRAYTVWLVRRGMLNRAVMVSTGDLQAADNVKIPWKWTGKK